MIQGEYVLELSCDQKEGCTRNGYFAYATRFLARQMAREEGWLLSLKGQNCYCPDHAAIRRAKWR